MKQFLVIFIPALAVVAVGVTAAMHGEADDAPGLAGLGILLITGAFVVAVEPPSASACHVRVTRDPGADERRLHEMEINKDLIAASSTPIVLAILAEEDSYGYAILQRVRELSGGRMEWTDGMLYPVLHRLERLGHVKARWELARPAAGASTTGSPRRAGRSSPRSAGSGRRWTRRCGASGGRFPSRRPRHGRALPQGA